jgi:hypothetical protein
MCVGSSLAKRASTDRSLARETDHQAYLLEEMARGPLDEIATSVPDRPTFYEVIFRDRTFPGLTDPYFVTSMPAWGSVNHPRANWRRFPVGACPLDSNHPRC